MERLFAQLSEDQKEKFRNCQNMDEVMKLVDEEELTQLTDDHLEFLASGGCCSRDFFCRNFLKHDQINTSKQDTMS